MINPKIVFILNLYSGLESSFKTGKWEPKGMPAVTFLFTELSKRRIHFKVQFLYSSPCDIKYHKILENFPEQKFEFYNIKRRKLFWNEIIVIYRKILISIKILLKYRRNPPIFYVDRDNVFIGAILSILGYPVILRLHGIGMYYEKFSDKKFILKNILKIISFKVAFKTIICTEDGTPCRAFLERYTHSQTKKYILINGVNQHNYNLINKKRILFVGRLENDKGCLEFARAVKLLIDKNVLCSVTIIGKGSLKNNMMELLKDNQNIEFYENVPLELMYKFYNDSDIYVSLNKLGNISNTVLEAMAAGNCIITTKPDSLNLRDISTFELFNGEFLFIDSNNIEDELSKILFFLLHNPDKVEQIKKKVYLKGLNILQSWDERMSKEVNIILD